MSSLLLSIPRHRRAEQTGSSKPQLLELLVFLFLLIPSLVLSYFTHGPQPGFDLMALATMLREAALVCLIVFFIWRNREGAARLGWSLRGFTREAALGAALFPLALLAGTTVNRGLRNVGFSGTAVKVSHAMTPAGAGQLVLAALLVGVVAICEETIFRGYLILRLKPLTGSTAAAVVLSTALFASGHGYEGAAGVSTVFVLGLVLAIVYVWRKSLVAPAVIHFLQDFLSLVLLPLMLHK